MNGALAGRSLALRAMTLALWAAPLVALALPGPGEAEVTQAVIALQGNPAPGGPAGTLFENGYPSVYTAYPQGLPSGHAAIEGKIVQGVGGVTADNDDVIWGPDWAGGLEPYAREGDQAPGMPAGVVFSSFTELSLEPTGQIWLTAVVEGPGITGNDDFGIWASDLSGNLILVAREGDPAPGRAGEFFRFFWSIKMLPDGRFLLHAYSDPSNFRYTGLWVADIGGDLQPLLVPGQETPGIPGVLIESVGYPGINALGQVLARFDLVFNSSSDQALVRIDSDDTATVFAREGDPVPQMPGHTYASNFQYSINDLGQVFFYVGTSGGIVVDLLGDSVANLQLIASTGSPVPDHPGLLLSSLYQSELSTAGLVAVGAVRLETGPAPSGTGGAVWSSDLGGSLELAVRQGDSLPGLDPAPTVLSVGRPTINNDGDIMVTLELYDPIQFIHRSQVLLRKGKDPVVLASVNDLVEVAPGDERTVYEISPDLSPANAGTSIVYHAEFTDGSFAIMRATLVENPAGVPTLGGAAILVLLLFVGSLAVIALRQRSFPRSA